MRHLIAVAVVLLVASTLAAETQPRIVLLAGVPSHGARQHEFEAGSYLLQDFLRQNGVDAVVATGGWPEDESIFEGARAVVFYMRGGPRHELLQGEHLRVASELMAAGVGMACLHYAVEVPVEHGPPLLEWIGGFYEKGHSMNPKQVVSVTRASPQHPISRGWDSFELKDEWYFRLRFRPEDARLTPILTAMLPKDDPQPERLAWAVERSDGGRGFGFTGGHYHDSWGHESFRRLVVNAILWTAKLEVPEGGARVELDHADLEKNLKAAPASSELAQDSGAAPATAATGRWAP